jgi:hypothetical protein
MDTPKAELIQAHLGELNQLYRMYAPTIDGEEAIAEEANTHLDWFRRNRILLHEDVKQQSYELCTLLQIRDQMQFDPSGLAVRASVDLLAVYKMLIGEPVKKVEAEAVLSALSEALEGPYNLDTVRVVVQ